MQPRTQSISNTRIFNQQSITFVAPFAHLGRGRGIGGAERQFILFGKGLKREGWLVAFITQKTNNERGHNTLGFKCYHADFSYLGGSKVRLPMSWYLLWQAMKQANANYYVVKVPGHLLALMSIFCRLRKRRLVFWSQTSFDADPKERVGINRVASMLQDWGLKRTDIVIAQTEEQKKAFKCNYGINAHVVQSICGRLNSAVSSKKVKGCKIDILWAGNSLPTKRQEVVFELARLLPHRTFAVAMNQSDERRFKWAEKAASKLQNVKFLGTVPQLDMEMWFSRTKVLINTSTREGFPNTFLQAWMNSVPVVSLNVDPDDIIKSNHLGLVVNNEQNRAVRETKFIELARQMIEPIERLLNNEKLRIQMGKNAAEYVRKNHVPDVVVPRLLEVLRRSI